MPNWYINKVQIRGPHEKLLAISNAFQDSKLLNFLCPQPEELLEKCRRLDDWEKAHPDWSKTKEGRDCRAEIAADDPYEALHEWRCTNWATKWEVDSRTHSDSLQMHEGCLSFVFDSAVNPPFYTFDAYRRSNDDISIKHLYYDDGLYDFVGVNFNGEDKCYNMSEIVYSCLSEVWRRSTVTTLREFENQYAPAVLESRVGRLSMHDVDSDEEEWKLPEPDAWG